MAKMLGFGQPVGTIMQVCYVVPDLARAIEFYVRTLNAGPFFVLPHRKQPDRVYRGFIELLPATAEMDATFPASGKLQSSGTEATRSGHFSDVIATPNPHAD